MDYAHEDVPDRLQKIWEGQEEPIKADEFAEYQNNSYWMRLLTSMVWKSISMKFVSASTRKYAMWSCDDGHGLVTKAVVTAPSQQAGLQVIWHPFFKSEQE